MKVNKGMTPDESYCVFDGNERKIAMLNLTKDECDALSIDLNKDFNDTLPSAFKDKNIFLYRYNTETISSAIERITDDIIEVYESYDNPGY